MARHAEYDRDAVIARATAVFWDRGYGKTSIGDLVAATGLQPGSLYAAFGNKKGLFVEVIDQYNRRFIARINGLREAPGRSIEKVEGLLRQIVDDAASGQAERGCLTVNALLELAEPCILRRLLGETSRAAPAMRLATRASSSTPRTAGKPGTACPSTAAT